LRVQKNQPRSLDAGKRERLFQQAIDPVRIARIADARLWKIIRAVLLLQTAEPLCGQKRAGGRRCELNERMPSFACAFRNQGEVLRQVRLQGRISLIPQVGVAVNRDLPGATAIVLTSRGETAEGLGILRTKML